MRVQLTDAQLQKNLTLSCPLLLLQTLVPSIHLDFENFTNFLEVTAVGTCVQLFWDCCPGSHKYYSLEKREESSLAGKQTNKYFLASVTAVYCWTLCINSQAGMWPVAFFFIFVSSFTFSEGWLVKGHTRTGMRRPVALAATHKVTIQDLDGLEKVMEVDESMSILEAAIDEGIDLAHDCKLGVCLTCPSRVVAGDVVQEGGTLEDSVVDAGIYAPNYLPRNLSVNIPLDPTNSSLSLPLGKNRVCVDVCVFSTLRLHHQNH